MSQRVYIDICVAVFHFLDESRQGLPPERADEISCRDRAFGENTVKGTGNQDGRRGRRIKPDHEGADSLFEANVEVGHCDVGEVADFERVTKFLAGLALLKTDIGQG
jgi:hypothetical protein